GGTGLFVMELAGGQPKAISPEGYRSFTRSVSPDGTRIAVVGPDRKDYLYPLAGGEPTAITGLGQDETIGGWTADGKALYVYSRRDIPGRLYRLELANGKRTLAREAMP